MSDRAMAERPVPSRENFPPQLVEATEHIAAGRMAKAEPILRRYVHDNPADVNGIRMLGEVGLSLGALRDAENLLKRAVELGRWPDGRPLTTEQRQECLQAVIAWGEKHLPPEQRIGYIDRGKKAGEVCGEPGEKPLNWQN